MQYSVFLLSGTQQQLEDCLAQIAKCMNSHQDDVRAYPLPQRGLRLCMGRALLPEGIYWGGLSSPWQSHVQDDASLGIAQP